MKSESKSKLGHITNIVLGFLGIIVYLILINTGRTINDYFGPLSNTILLAGAVVLFVGSLTLNINPGIFRYSIVILYGLFAVLSILVKFGNNMMFQVMMLTLGCISMFKRRRMLQALFAVDIIVVVLTVLITHLWPNIFSNVYSITDYVVNLLILLVEFIAFNLQLNSFLERMQIDRESRQTVNELIKVVDAKREEAMRANHSKSDFLASMSHEIRTPINAVLGFNEMILRETRDETIAEYSKDILSSSTSLLSLVNDILDFSKIEAGKMEIIPVVYDMGSLLNDIVNMIGIRAAEKGLSFRINVAPSLPRELYGDEVRIKQVMINLLTNAVKYTDKGIVTLTIDYKKLDDFQIRLNVKVEDTGRGIRAEDMEKLFSPFERIEEVSNRHIEGTGLGISLTRTLLHMMDSRLEVESAYGFGSNFSFELTQEVEKWDPVGSLDEAINRVKADADRPRTVFVAPLAKVLVVDDIPVNLKVFNSLLKRTQMEVDTASSGMEALTLMRKQKYDIIFLDHMMPEMDGIETLSRMNSDRFNLNRFETPVIALTANAVSGARELYLEKGFADYVTKPVDSSRLESVILKYLRDDLIVKMDEEVLQEEKIIESESSHISALRHLPDINVNAGIEASGGSEIYEDVVHDYMQTIDEYSDRIERFFDSRDWENYRIQVHALKSTSRMIGAMELSELAKDLEAASVPEHLNIELIEAKTPKLLFMYRSLKEGLSGVFAEDEASKDIMEKETFIEALSAIKEGVELFDYDLIESVMAELDAHRIPDEYVSVYKRMKLLVADVNTDELGDLIDLTLRSGAAM